MDAIVYIYIYIIIITKAADCKRGRSDPIFPLLSYHFHAILLLAAFFLRPACESEKRISFFAFTGPPPIPTWKQGNSGRISNFLPRDFLQLVN